MEMQSGLLDVLFRSNLEVKRKLGCILVVFVMHSNTCNMWLMVVLFGAGDAIGYHGVHHVGLLCSNLERSLEFYQGLLGEKNLRVLVILTSESVCDFI